MEARRFNRYWLATVVGLGLLQVLISIAADPYCVFGVIRYPKRNFEPNTRFLKIEYLRRHREYDAFILGSSRASYLDTETATHLCAPQARYYNLNASLEIGAGIRRKLDWLTRDRSLRQAMIVVDFDLQSVRADGLDLLRQDHPLVTGDGHLRFYAKYLMFQPRILSLYIRGLSRPTKLEPWRGGSASSNEPLYRIRPFFDLQALYDITVGAARQDLSELSQAADTISPIGHDELRKTLARLDAAGVPYRLIIPPYRLDQFASFNLDALMDWLGKTVDLSKGIWNFSGYNSVTADPNNYADRIHFNRATGDRIIERICSPLGGKAGVESFGVYVTPANRDEHLASIREQHRRAQAAALGLQKNMQACLSCADPATRPN